MKKAFLGIICIGLLFAACKKRKDVNGDIKNRYEILTSRTWVLVSQKINNNPVPLKDCEKDNYWVFNTDHSGKLDEGTNNCLDTTGGSESPISYTDFRWYNTSDQRFIYIKDFGQIGHDPEWEINNMDYKSMDITTSEKIGEKLFTYQYKFVVK